MLSAQKSQLWNHPGSLMKLKKALIKLVLATATTSYIVMRHFLLNKSLCISADTEQNEPPSHGWVVGLNE